MNFDSLSPPGLDGHIMFSRFPGRDDAEGFTQQRLHEVLNALVTQGCRTLVSLTEDSEFDYFNANPVFAKSVSERNLIWHRLPIADYQIPNKELLVQWRTVSKTLLSQLAANHNICVHCKGGIGRSGTVAAMLLIDHGLSNDESIKCVRRARKGAIETAEQEAFVQAYRPVT